MARPESNRRSLGLKNVCGSKNPLFVSGAIKKLSFGTTIDSILHLKLISSFQG